MPKFSYKVRDREDRVVLGTMEAVNTDEVIDKLSRRDLFPVSVEEIDFGARGPRKSIREQLGEDFRRSRSRVPYKSVVFFTRQLATMVGQGVPLSRALEQLQKGEKPGFQKVIKQVADDISTGLTLSDAVARHPGAFSPMYVAVTHSGEVAGALDRVLDGLATYMENVEIMRGKIKTAMRYPMFIGGFVTLMLIGILWKLVPTFESIYGSLKATLPPPTQLLILVSRLVRENTLVCIGIALALAAAFKVLMTQESFQVAVEKNLLRLPVFGTILKKNIWATYCRTMSLLLEAGTPILKATEIAGATVNNRYFASRLGQVYGGLRRGELLSEALESSGLFPVLIIQLTATGESSGRVDELLRKAAEFHEREIRNVVDSLSTIIEPILITVLGAGVGGVLFALYMPIFMIGKFVK
ncbi:MAG TPA: type II secretion system F family protein [Fibrobacteria bacterium]|nr:type II secretion system F family protein [Fibrobacteria bacterium]